jgi:hypothetical protein
MDLRFVPPDLRRLEAAGGEMIACGIWSDERPLPGLAGLLDWRLAGRLSRLARDHFLAGSLGEVMFVPGRPRLPFDKVIVLGLGAKASFGDDAFRLALQRLLATAAGLQVRKAVVELPGRGDQTMDVERAAELVVEVMGAQPPADAWWLVESLEGERKFTKVTEEKRRQRRP